MGDQVGVPRIGQAPRQPVGQPEAVIDLPQGQQAGAADQPFGAFFDDDRAVEIELEKRMLGFTHGVHLRVRFVTVKTPTKLHAEAAFLSAMRRPE
jgi:hypothetical protein